MKLVYGGVDCVSEGPEDFKEQGCWNLMIKLQEELLETNIENACFDVRSLLSGESGERQVTVVSNRLTTNYKYHAAMQVINDILWMCWMVYCRREKQVSLMWLAVVLDYHLLFWSPAFKKNRLKENEL